MILELKDESAVSFVDKNSVTVVKCKYIEFLTKQGESMFKKFIVLTILAVSAVVFLPSQAKAAAPNNITYSENITTPATVLSFQRRNRRSRRWENRRWRNDRNRRINRRDDRRNNRRRGRGRN